MAPARVVGETAFQVKETDAADGTVEQVTRAFTDALSHGDLIDRDAAAAAKDRLDAEAGGVWHCVLGTDFGAYVTHARGCYVQLAGVGGRAAGKMAIAYKT